MCYKFDEIKNIVKTKRNGWKSKYRIVRNSYSIHVLNMTGISFHHALVEIALNHVGRQEIVS